MKDFLLHLLDVFFPDPRRTDCPHCGGGRCLKLCMLLGNPLKAPSPREDAEDEEEG